MRHYVNFLLLGCFAVLLTTGVMRFVRPFDLVVTRVHVVAGFSVAGLVGLHLLGRMGYFRGMARGSRASGGRWRGPRILAIALLGSTLLLAATIYQWPPVPSILRQSYESRHRAVIFRAGERTATHALPNRLEVRRVVDAEAGLKVDIDWGPAYRDDETFAAPFRNAQPQLAVWTEGPAGDLIETLFVSEESAYAESISWDGNLLDRVSILPVWRHRYTLVSGVEPDGDLDAYSAATPSHSFSLEDYLAGGGKPFSLYVEVNIPGDPNEYFHAHQEETASGYCLPGVGQPSVVYAIYIDPAEGRRYYLLDLVGHGGSSREQDGKIFYNLDEITTAAQIVDKILVRVDFQGNPSAQ